MNQRPNSSQFNQFQSGFMPSGGTYTPGAAPPPLPPRAVNHGTTSYNPYMRNSMLGYGGYGYTSGFPFGQFNPGFGSYPYGSSYGAGPSGDVENRIIQFAEESTRPAFQSIQSIITTFSSVTMMLESTFLAMTSSFRAILSVAENVGKVRSMFVQLWNTFALIRFAKWLYKYVAYKLGLSPTDPRDESLWKSVESVVGGEKGPSTWPILLFFSLLAVIPYLVHKLVNSVQQSKPAAVINPQAWFELNEPVYWATAMYDFNAGSPEEISLKAGQKVWLAPQSLQPKNMPGWSRATDKTRVGFIPSNYINVGAQVTRKSDTDAYASSSSTKDLEENFKDANAETKRPESCNDDESLVNNS
ncbi:peroxisomal membrane protein PEX13 isoform X1 [Cotesia glomerata]|uniref:Peroxisomal membrane protein PEX13 n=1 Tax=Cotesia glomerata TaxID=32391 RepID=A0AAV7HUY4_COTGL|nr:peroxisomal membrane protein PEX13 isoform X1 [Cotesia glomerata]KAH0535526.1 hypothetical protein KQX54_016954 [Cotesia glomerata]